MPRVAGGPPRGIEAPSAARGLCWRAAVDGCAPVRVRSGGFWVWHRVGRCDLMRNPRGGSARNPPPFRVRSKHALFSACAHPACGARLLYQNERQLLVLRDKSAAPLAAVTGTPPWLGSTDQDNGTLPWGVQVRPGTRSAGRTKVGGSFLFPCALSRFVRWIQIFPPRRTRVYGSDSSGERRGR